MPFRLKDLKITSTDLVEHGANPDAHIRLFKLADKHDNSESRESIMQKVIDAITGVFGKSATTFADELDERKLREVSGQAWDYSYMLSDSLYSIIFDSELTEDEKRSKMNTSVDQFCETIRTAIPQWAAGNTVEVRREDSVVAKSDAQRAALEELIERYAITVEPEPVQPNDATQKSTTYQKEETDTMKIDKSHMSPEELAALEAIEKKYGIADTDEKADPDKKDADNVEKSGEPTVTETVTTTTELHPDVKKALESNAALVKEVDELRKSLEIERLTGVAKKYGIIGKKPDELAVKLYDLKKAGGTHYDDTIALLDEQVILAEKSGLFSELGTSRSGVSGTDTEIGAAASELKKSNADITTPEAIVKAFEGNPELAAQYEADYLNGRA